MALCRAARDWPLGAAPWLADRRHAPGSCVALQPRAGRHVAAASSAGWRCRALWSGYRHFCVAACGSGVHRSHHQIDMRPHPLDGVACEKCRERCWRALVEEDAHQRALDGAARLRAAKSSTSTIWSRVRSNHATISSMLAPASRFSKTVATGMRAPRNTHAPLTFPGLHCGALRPIKRHRTNLLSLHVPPAARPFPTVNLPLCRPGGKARPGSPAHQSHRVNRRPRPEREARDRYSDLRRQAGAHEYLPPAP
jgi:hypothetical protein